MHQGVRGGPGQHGRALWQTFVQRFTCGDAALADYLQRVAGAAAVGHVYQEQLIIAYGSGGNGKSTFSTFWRVFWVAMRAL